MSLSLPSVLMVPMSEALWVSNDAIHTDLQCAGPESHLALNDSLQVANTVQCMVLSQPRETKMKDLALALFVRTARGSENYIWELP